MKQLILLVSIFSAGMSFAQTEPLPPPPDPIPVEKKQPEIIAVIDEPAEFPGGIAAMKKFLAENLVYPESAREKGIEGKAYLKFVVGTDGKLTDIKVVRGVVDCPECDAEAIRVVKLMPNWIPGKNAGKPVKSYYNLPIVFRAQEGAPSKF